MEETGLGQLKVLLVDDDDFMLDLLIVTLNGIGVTNVTTACEGEQALRIMDMHPGGHFDGILCDLNMPRMDGLEVLGHLADRKYQGGVILISGVDSRVLNAAHELAEARLLNVLGALDKPISKALLTGLLHQLELPASSQELSSDEDVIAESAPVIINDDMVDIYFQPRVTIATRKIAGVEVLARWRDANNKTVRPDGFIDLSLEHGHREEDELIGALAEIVCRQAIRQGGTWRKAGQKLSVSMNISIEHLARADFPNVLIAIANRYELEAKHIIMGVDENQILRNPTMSLEIISRLRLKGVGLSIESFTIDSTILETMKSIPFTLLKVGRELLNRAATDQSVRQPLESEIGLAREMGLALIAEDIETERDWELADQFGCDFAQGGFIGRPLQAEGFDAWMKEAQWS